jgi:hypothetical protein
MVVGGLWGVYKVVWGRPSGEGGIWGGSQLHAVTWPVTWVGGFHVAGERGAGKVVWRGGDASWYVLGRSSVHRPVT